MERVGGAHLTSLRPGSTASFQEMLQQWRAVGKTMSNLNGTRFEPRTYRSRDKRITTRPRNSIF